MAVLRLLIRQYFSRKFLNLKTSTFSKVILFCSVLLVLGPLRAQYASIPDSSFRQALIRLGYGPDFDNTQTMIDTTAAAVLNTDTMDVGVSSILDLTGIRYFKGLKYLNCYHNPFTFLPALPDSLTYLTCYDGLVTSLPALPNTIRYLNLGDNFITNLPALPDSLRFLSIETNEITALPALPPYLNYFTCYGNTIDSLPRLPDSLTFLDCGVNALRSLPSLPSSLTYLSCGVNILDSLPALPAVLTRLYCNNNNLSSLPSLPAHLERLDCFVNRLSTLPVLPASLAWLDCSYNRLSTIPALPDSLHNFSCRVNMDLYCLPQLKKILYLSFDSTGIYCLPDFPQENVFCSPALNTISTCGLSNPHGCLTYAGIADISSDALNIYPNPAFDRINVKLNTNSNPALSYTINDLEGRSILSALAELQGGTITIDISGLSSGVYLLSIGGSVAKVVKE